MNKFGFTLIELSLAITITAILVPILYNSYYQINKAALNIDDMISIDTRAIILQNRFEKDISGAFLPNITPIKTIEPIKEQQTKAGEKQIINKENKEVQTKEEKLEKAFYSSNQDKILKEITFITCNPLEIYNQSKPRIARIIYSVREDKNNKESYSLFRKESGNIIYGADKDAIEYEIVDNIKEISLEFIIPEEEKQIPKEETKQKEESTKPKPIIYKTLTQFDSNTEKSIFKIPLNVNMKISFWNNSKHESDQIFEFKYIIYTFESELIKEMQKRFLEEQEKQRKIKEEMAKKEKEQKEKNNKQNDKK